MDRIDPAGEYLRMAERYRLMSDEELLVLMPQISELTDSARQALESEFRSRKLTVGIDDIAQCEAPKSSNAAEGQSPDGEAAEADSEEQDGAYAEDRELVELTSVWSARDALKLQGILDEAGIPFYIGPEKATGVDQVTSDFSKGVSVKIMKIGMPWAMPLMQHYEPEDDPTPEPEEVKEAPVRCPVCHSTEVVFDGLSDEKASETDETSEKFKWTCDACGNRWEDDGVAKEG